MKKINEINERRKLKAELAGEKLRHISDILKYKFALNNTCEINKKEYAILIEDEGILIRHTYNNIEELVGLDVDIETHILRRAFCMCLGSDEFSL